MKYIIDDKKFKFRTAFDTETGTYIRTGIIDKDGNNTGIDPFMASFAHFIDVGIMGIAYMFKQGSVLKRESNAIKMEFA